MGTRGLYAFKWRGKYYVYYNQYDSYPDGLGRSLVRQIPSDPEKYRKWLQKSRTEYSEVAKALESVFTISMDKFGESTQIEESELEDFENIPGYLAPELDLFIEWVYVIDLDKELFGVDNTCFFHLSKIPRKFETLLQEGQNFWLGKVGQDEVHESITTNDVQPIPLTDDPTPAFLQMKPTIIYPKKESMLNHMPAFVACKRIYELLLDKYEGYICQAQDTDIESDFLFKELVFAMMCFASCSPEWVRLISSANMMYKKEGKAGKCECGVILDHSTARKPKEFVTRFLRGYHLEGMESGSAPKPTSYWFSGALVFLRHDITSRERFHDAILSAVAKGKADGRTHFNAIIISLKHFVLLKFADGIMQHTKRLKLGACPEYKREGVIPNDEEEEESENEEKPENDEEESENDEEESENGEKSVEKEETKERGDSGKKQNTEEEGELGRNSSEPETTTDNDGCQNVSGGAHPSSPDKTTHDSCDESPDENPDKNPDENPEDSPEDSDWADNADVATFEILAHFFDATQKQGLKPSMIHNEGIFPNEVYQRILSHVDRETNMACLQVSRPFREFASETFVMDDGLKLVYRPGKEPECFHDTVGFVGPFKPDSNPNFRGCVEWLPVFGTPDGSASMEARIALAFPSLLKTDGEGSGPEREKNYFEMVARRTTFITIG